MSFFPRHRPYMLVVFALAATLGLSSCADTFTGYIDQESQASTEDVVSVDDAARQSTTHHRPRTLPTPGDETVWPDPAASQQHEAGESFHVEDSVKAPPPPLPKKVVVRY